MNPIKYFLATILLLATFPLFSQILNDDCSSAIELIVSAAGTCDNAAFGTTQYAAASNLGQCGPERADVWYSFVATETVHEVRVFNVQQVYYPYYQDNFILEVFSGSCGQLQHLYCSNNYGGIRLGDLMPGDTYFLRIAPPDNTPIEFQICVTSVNQPQPSNDLCANATVLVVDPHIDCTAPTGGSTENTTTSPCSICLNGYDVWYAFTATQATHVVRLSEIKRVVENDITTLTVEVYTGSCGNLEMFNSARDMTGQGSLTFTELVVGQTYYVRLFNYYYFNEPLQFNICVTAPPPPPNDACTGATAIVPSTVLDCSEPLNGSLLGATASGTDCEAQAVLDVWYQFIAGSPSQRVSVTPSVPDNYGFEVYSGDCTNPVSLACVISYERARTLTGLTTGATYYLRVFSPLHATFDFQLCVLNLPPPPPNDECAGALPAPVNAGLSADLYTDGSTLGTTSSLPECGGTESTHDLWYSFTATSVSHRLLVQDYGDIFGDSRQLGYEVYQGDCDHLSSLACGHHAPNYFDETLLGGLTPGNTYFVRIYSFIGSNHKFRLILQTLPPPPANRNCAQAETLTSAPLPGCGMPVTGNTAGVIALETGSCVEGKQLWYTFTALHTTEVVQVSDVQAFFGGSFLLEAYEDDGTGCGNLNFLQCYYSPTTIYLNHLTLGKTYYLRWFSGYESAHTFQLCLSHFFAPANDECAGALPLTVHGNMNCYYPASGNTAGSTASQPASCGTNVDVWFRFKAIQATQQIMVGNVEAVQDGNFVPLHAELLSGSCGNLTSLYCWPASLTVPSFTQLVGDLVPGQTYYLRLTNAEDIPARFEVCVLTPPKPPGNDNCINATALIPAADGNYTSTAGSTEYASPTPGLPLPPSPVEGDVWYSFIASQSNHDVLIGYVNGYGWPYGDGAMVEAYASACGQFNFLAKQRMDGAGTLHLTGLTPGATYYIRIVAGDASYIGFSICINTPPLPANDECINALPLAVGSGLDCNYVTMSTFGATQSQPDCDGNADVDIWYQFTATEATYRFDLYVPPSQGGEGGIEVFSGDCDHLVPLFCRTLPTLPVVFQEGGFTPGVTYYLRVWGKPNTLEEWSMCVLALPPAPVNDDCATASLLPLHTTLPCAAPTLGSTLSANASQPSCEGVVVQDIWYTFTATSAVNILDVSILKNYFGTNFAGYELFSGDCNTASSLRCRDYFSGSYQELLPDLTPGQVYFLRVYSHYPQAQDFSICLTTYPIPPNDLCENAVALAVAPTPTCDTLTAGTAISAGISGTIGCGSSGGDVWYTFTATQAAHTIDLYTSFNYFDLEIYRDGCGSLQPVICHVSRLGTDHFTLGELTAGTQYWIRVVGDVNFNICVGTPDIPPANDACSGAIALPVSPDENCSNPVSGTTEFATPSSQVFSYASNANDVWHTFTATQANHVVLVTNVVNPNGYDMFVEAYTGTCGALSKLEVQQYFQGNQLLYVLTNLTPGATYYVRVFVNVSLTPGTFDICVISPPRPVNDECANATPLPVNTDLSCQQSLMTTTYGATQSAPACAGGSANDVWYQFTATATISRLDIELTSYGIDEIYGVEILEGDCTAPTVVLPCVEYAYGQAVLPLHTVIGHTYYLRLYVPPIDFKNFHICLRNLPAAPANDDCLQATIIQPGSGVDCGPVYDGTTLAASQSGTDCYGNASDDVWYQFTATSTGHIIHLLGGDYPLGEGSYPAFEMYSGPDCNDLTSVTCFYFNSLTGGMKILEDLTTGGTYFIRVFAEKNHPYDFSLCLGTLPPLSANVICEGAVEVVPSPDTQCTQPVAGTTAGLTAVSNQVCSFTTTLWYHFQATSTTHFIQLQNVVHQYGDPFLNLGLYRGDCSNPQYLYCTDQREILAANLTPGADYYIVVGGKGLSGTSFHLCLLTPTPPPTNDHCADAVMLAVSPTLDCVGKVSGNNLGATGSYGIDCGNGPDVWYAFVATSTEQVINISNVHLTTGDAFIEVLQGDCAATWVSQVGCYYIYNGSSNTPILHNLEPGQTYYLRIGSFFPSYLGFDICITTPQPNLATQYIQLYSDGCHPSNQESIGVSFTNLGIGYIAANAAQFTLTVSGANSGTYGPISNDYALYYYENQSVIFTGVDLSNLGQNELTVTAMLPNDQNIADNTSTRSFTGLPLLALYRDADEDGYGNILEPLTACSATSGYVTDHTDCNDNANWIYPGATEICDGDDNDCNLLTDAADPGLSGAPLPAIACPDNIIHSNDAGTCSAVVNYIVTTSDHCGYTLSQSDGLASGETFPVGTTVNTFTVRDPGSNSAACSFTVEVQKTADPDLLYAYTVIGFNDVLLNNNIVQSGGVGLVNANKKARLQGGTTVTAPYTFVQAPLLELLDGSQVTTAYTGQVATGLLPAFQPNSTPSSNNLTIPSNISPVTLTAGSYGNLTIGVNATVTFSGHTTVRIKELTIKDGAKILFAQHTDLLINKGITIAKNVAFNPAGLHVQCFAGENVTINQGTQFLANIYTLKDLQLAAATATVPTKMTGLFIANNVSAQDFVNWNWNARCPFDPNAPLVAVREDHNHAQPTLFEPLQISPNPASEEVQVRFYLETDSEVTLQMLDAAGRLVQTKRFTAVQGANQYQLELGTLPEGMYYVQLLAQGRRELEKLVVLRP